MSEQGKKQTTSFSSNKISNKTKTEETKHVSQTAPSSDSPKSPDVAPASSENSDTAAEATTALQTPSFKTQLIAIIITFVVVALAVLFGILLVTKKGVFHEPGKILFANAEDLTGSDDDNMLSPVTEVGQNFINENLQDIELKSDLTISTKTTLAKLANETDTTNSVLYQILVPTTDFYNMMTSISTAEAKALINNKSDDSENTEITLTSIWDLTSEQRLLAIDDNYYLDTLDSGAFFEYYILDGDAEDVEKVKTALEAKIQAFPTSDEILTFAQTGVTALSRGMNRKLDQVGDANYFSANIGEYLSHFDLTHTSNESSFSASANDRNICSKPNMIDVITSSGFDIIELTGNHNQDCGDNDAIATIDLCNSLGIKTVGGGKTAAESAIPLEISDKGTNITMLAYNYSTGGYTTDNTPGANLYTDEKAKSDIAAAKERGDFIIVDVQFFECNSYVNTSEDTTCDYANSSAGDQVGFFRNLIDLGADIVVGTSAHQPQTFELYKDGAIYYGLGNLFFDQAWWPGTTRSIILVHYFLDGKLVQTRLVPTVYDQTYQTKLMEDKDAEAFLTRLVKVRP